MLLGQVSSGLFSGSPGLSSIFSLFLTSSMRSLAALESSNKSLRTMSFGARPFVEYCDDSRLGGCVVLPLLCELLGEVLVTSAEEWVAGVWAEL